MLRQERSAPIWLFSFVDLAFLLLIAFTQIATDRDSSSIEVAELEIPKIRGSGAQIDGPSPAPNWQLRVQPVATADVANHAPFALIQPGDVEATPEAISAEELAAHLQLLHSRKSAKPVLAPHRDSRSEDLLIAVELLEDVWRGQRTVAVRPGAAVASGPEDATR